MVSRNAVLGRYISFVVLFFSFGFASATEKILKCVVVDQYIGSSQVAGLMQKVGEVHLYSLKEDAIYRILDGVYLDKVPVIEKSKDLIRAELSTLLGGYDRVDDKFSIYSNGLMIWEHPHTNVRTGHTESFRDTYRCEVSAELGPKKKLW